MKSNLRPFVRPLAALAIAVVALSGAAIALQQDPAAPAAPVAPAAKAEVVVPFIGNATCPMQAGKKVNPGKYVTHEKQRAYYCCGKCQGAAKADPKAALAAAYPAAKAVGNKKCPVSGHAIEAGKAKSVTFMGHAIDLCCGDCEASFAKNPYVLAVCAIYGCEDLGNAKCPVMDEESNDEDLVIYKGKLVRLCCADCVTTEFKTDPDKFLAKASAK
ncbi:MAG: hypothetical protein FJ293_14135 [Planctomycetes bacterium]|nr:hypothetical protein [Planctomycetota bacterium]